MEALTAESTRLCYEFHTNPAAVVKPDDWHHTCIDVSSVIQLEKSLSCASLAFPFMFSPSLATTPLYHRLQSLECITMEQFKMNEPFFLP